LADNRHVTARAFVVASCDCALVVSSYLVVASIVGWTLPLTAAAAGLLATLGLNATRRLVVAPPAPARVIDLTDPATRRVVVTEADLLGRGEVTDEVESTSGYITGRRVLVTGAGGSIGSELCAQLWHRQPAALFMLDRDESALHAVQLALHGRALLDDDGLIVADVRDRARISEIVGATQPDVIFHAAALKHLPLLERHPSEAVKTNIWGTQHVLEAARAHGVLRFVNISTDKAADPISVLGYSKRITERLTASMALDVPGTYLSVRFGNVLGSRGSALTAFRAQIAAGEPVTVTHPDVTRYFMTVQEAVSLVLQAGAIGRPGEVLVLDMGEPVRIADVAQRLIDASGADVRIVYTGLRFGEKLHEDLFGDGETDERPVSPSISHVAAPPLAIIRLHHLDEAPSPASLIERMRDVATEPVVNGWADQPRMSATERM